MDIRTGTREDLSAIAEVEALCFPPAEAASKESFRRRLEVYPDHFWLLWDGDTLVGFVNGMVTDEPDLRDEMFDDAALHNSAGSWQMIFGVATRPDYQRQGCAAKLLRRAITDTGHQGRAGLVLTCKDYRIPYYARFGFEDEGVCGSSHGGAVWHQMRLTF